MTEQNASIWDWDRFLTERDRSIFAEAGSGYGSEAPLGEHAAVIVIDTTYEFTGPQGSKLPDVLKEYPNACGEDAWNAVDNMKRLILAARRSNVPVIYTKGDVTHQVLDRASWGQKNSRLIDRPEGTNEIVRDIAPLTGEPIIQKVKPSGFFDTPLRQYLTVLRCDQLIMCGGTTSGCVRATVVDGFSAGYRVAVAGDAVFDRAEASHAIALFDINAKYGNVMTTRALTDYLKNSHLEE